MELRFHVQTVVDYAVKSTKIMRRADISLSQNIEKEHKMTMKFKVVGSIFVIAILTIVIFNNQSETTSSTTEANFKTSSALIAQNNSAPSKELGTSKNAKSYTEKELPEEVQTTDEKQVASNNDTDNLYINGLYLEKAESINNAFLDTEDRVHRQALSEIFTVEDFSNLINQLKDVEETDLSIEREGKLGLAFNNITENIYNENYTCRGRVCAVTFNHDSNGEVDVDELGAFDSNYTFKNAVENDSGDVQIKVVFIQTEDPSTLQLTY